MTSVKNDVSDLRSRGIFITLAVAAFATSMATTVTGNTIPNFTAYFGVSPNLAQWLTSGATLISGVAVPITAFFIKRVPNKPYFLGAMSAFTVGSLAGSFRLAVRRDRGRRRRRDFVSQKRCPSRSVSEAGIKNKIRK